MKLKVLKNLLLGLATVCVGHTARAQNPGTTNYQWSAAGDAATWSQVANWTQGALPPTDGTTWQIDISANAGGSVVPIQIAATDVVNIDDSLFGPEGGQTLDIYGNVTLGYGEFVWGAIGGPVTTLNIHTDASLSLNDTLALGTAWWFPGGPNVVMNVYTNAQVGVTWMQFGAHLNMYGGTLSVTNGFNTGTATTPIWPGGLDTDATRSINLQFGATLVLPASYTATVDDWINRGILQVYGEPNDAADIVIDEANTNWPGRTVVYTTATSATPVAVHIAVPRTSLYVGGLEQAQALADYPTLTGVDITTGSTFSIGYNSTAPSVAIINASGQVQAVGVGSATLWVVVGTLSNSVDVTVSAYTSTAVLMHRYSFSDDVASYTVTDSVAGNSPTWDGTLNGGATLTGSQLVLDGSSGFVQLPAGIINNMDAVTVETWATFGTIPDWAVLFAFGDTTGTAGFNYLSCQPHTGAGTAQTGIKNAVTEENPFFTPVLDNYTNVFIAAVFHPEAGYCSIYTNGVLAAINSSINITMADVTASGDPYNYIGHSLYSADPYLPASIDEFRIYSGPLTAGQIAAHAALGPDQLLGTSTNISLAVTHPGGNFVFSWPTTSALVTLLSSPTLGAGAVWTPVTAPLTVVGGSYQASVSSTSGTRFFRLQQ